MNRAVGCSTFGLNIKNALFTIGSLNVSSDETPSNYSMHKQIFYKWKYPQKLKRRKSYCSESYVLGFFLTQILIYFVLGRTPGYKIILKSSFMGYNSYSPHKQAVSNCSQVNFHIYLFE